MPHTTPKQASFTTGRFGSTLLWPAAKILFAVGYSSFFIYALFFARRRRGLTERYLNPVPINASVKNFLALGHAETKEWIAFGTNLFGNIALFIPLPFLLISFLRIRTLPNVLLASFIASLSVEAMQFLFKRGVADVDDILLNVLGALIGFFLCSKLFGFAATAKN